MVRCVANLFLLSAVAGALVACSSNKNEPEENPNVFPANYKNEILTRMTSTLENPTNVHDAYISDPVLRPVGKNERYVVCVRSDSRNASNHYAGSKDRIALFYDGHLDQLIEATKEQCESTAYKPFPE